MEDVLSTDHLQAEGNWKSIWNLKVPPKLKHFLWRVTRGCLPTRTNLRRRGIDCTTGCVFCQEHFESEWHVFVACSKAREMWTAAGIHYLLEQKFNEAEGIKELM